MKIFLAFLAALLLAVNAGAQTNTLYADVRDYGLTAQNRCTVTLTLLSPNPRTYNGSMIRQDPIAKTTGSDGRAYFTNIIWGTYRVDISGAIGTRFPITVGTNTLGFISIASLYPAPGVLPPNPATNYYTQAQIDALLSGIQTDIEAATNVIQVAAGTNMVAVTNGTLVTPSLSAAPYISGANVTNVGGANIVDGTITTNKMAAAAYLAFLGGSASALTNGADAWLATLDIKPGLGGGDPFIGFDSGALKIRSYSDYLNISPETGTKEFYIGLKSGIEGMFAPYFVGSGDKLTNSLGYYFASTNWVSSRQLTTNNVSGAPTVGYVPKIQASGVVGWAADDGGSVGTTETVLADYPLFATELPTHTFTVTMTNSPSLNGQYVTNLNLTYATNQGTVVSNGVITFTQNATNGTVAKAVSSSNATNFFGQLSVTNLNGGSGASVGSFWRGDGRWGYPEGVLTNKQAGTTYFSTLGVSNSVLATNYFTESDGSAGLFRPLANTLSLKVASADVVYIDNSRNVGIGTTQPSEKLHVAGNITAGNYYGNGRYLTNSDGVPYMLTNAILATNNFAGSPVVGYIPKVLSNGAIAWSAESVQTNFDSITVSNDMVVAGNIYGDFGSATNSSGYYFATTNDVVNATNGLNTSLRQNITNHGLTYLPIVGGTLSGNVLTTSSSTNSPAQTELVTAGWVRGLFDGFGVAYYATTNQNNTFTNAGIATTNTLFFEFNTTQPTYYSTRVYVTPTNGSYMGQVVSTNKVMAIASGITVSAMLSVDSGGSGTGGPTIKPEIYVSYDRTNWFGDWSASYQSIPEGGTNLYVWTVANPSFTATNDGVYVMRTFKIGVQPSPAASTITFHVGTNAVVQTPSHIALSSSSTAGGNAFLSANQTWTGTNVFTKPIVADGSGITNLSTGAITNGVAASDGDAIVKSGSQFRMVSGLVANTNHALYIGLNATNHSNAKSADATNEVTRAVTASTNLAALKVATSNLVGTVTGPFVGLGSGLTNANGFAFASTNEADLTVSNIYFANIYGDFSAATNASGSRFTSLAELQSATNGITGGGGGGFTNGYAFNTNQFTVANNTNVSLSSANLALSDTISTNALGTFVAKFVGDGSGLTNMLSSVTRPIFSTTFSVLNIPDGMASIGAWTMTSTGLLAPAAILTGWSNSVYLDQKTVIDDVYVSATFIPLHTQMRAGIFKNATGQGQVGIYCLVNGGSKTFDVYQEYLGVKTEMGAASISNLVVGNSYQVTLEKSDQSHIKAVFTDLVTQSNSVVTVDSGSVNAHDNPGVFDLSQGSTGQPDVLFTSFSYGVRGTRSPRVLFLGDSITEGETVTDKDGRYAAILRDWLGGNAVIAGRGGESAETVLNRLAIDLDSFRPDYTLIYLNNDSVMGNWLNAVTNVINRIISRSSIPILTTLGPWTNTTKQAFFNLANAWILTNSTTYGYRIWDAASALGTNHNRQVANTDLLLSDGIHPTAGGHALLAQSAINQLPDVFGTVPKNGERHFASDTIGNWRGSNRVTIGSSAQLGSLNVEPLAAQPVITVGRAPGQASIKGTDAYLIIDAADGQTLSLNHYGTGSTILMNQSGGRFYGGPWLDVAQGGIENAYMSVLGTPLLENIMRLDYPEGTIRFLVRTNGSVIFSGTVTATNGFFLPTRTGPPVVAGGGTLWNSNSVLYWVTATKTNLVSDGR